MIGLQTTVVSEKRKLQDSMYAMKLFLLKKKKNTHIHKIYILAYSLMQFLGRMYTRGIFSWLTLGRGIVWLR